MVRTKEMLHTSPISLVRTTDNGHPERDSIQKEKESWFSVGGFGMETSSF